MEFASPPRAGLLARFDAHLAEGETSDRTFGLAVGAIFIVLSLLPLLRHRPPALWMLAPGVPLLVLGMVAPGSLRRLKRAWLFLGFAIGLVVNPAVLAILFYAVLTPCGFLMRLFGGDPLRLRPSPGLSYWREHSTPISTMKDQF